VDSISLRIVSSSFQVWRFRLFSQHPTDKGKKVLEPAHRGNIFAGSFHGLAAFERRPRRMPGYKPQCSLVTDYHLSEQPVFFVIAKRFNNLVEGKHASYDWLQPIDGNCAVHRDELRPVARKNDTERSDRIVEQIDVNFRGTLG
jgi:hypothetical protein